MSVPVLTFFNNKGGVWKTSLVYHLAWMMSAIGQRQVSRNQLQCVRNVLESWVLPIADAGERFDAAINGRAFRASIV